MKIKIIYNARFARPWFGFGKPKKGWLYGRVWKWPFQKTRVYFSLPKEEALRKVEGKYWYEEILRHELEHVFQHFENRFFRIKYMLEGLKHLIKTRSFEKAYLNNKYEVAAREAGAKGLCESFAMLFE